MYVPIYLAMSQLGCLAAFADRSLCEHYCEENGYDLIIVDRKNISQYL